MTQEEMDRVTAEEIIAWLRTLPGNTPLGEYDGTNYNCGCPVATWLRGAKGQQDASVMSAFSAYVDGQRLVLPRSVGRVVQVFDSGVLVGSTHTVAEFLEVWDAVR